jgi:hypothetical protein
MRYNNTKLCTLSPLNQSLTCATLICNLSKVKDRYIVTYLLTHPLFAGVSRVRALSPAWTGSHARETLISCTHLFLPHDLPPTKKSSTIQAWPIFCDQYFWKFPIWNSRADEKLLVITIYFWIYRQGKGNLAAYSCNPHCNHANSANALEGYEEGRWMVIFG